MNVTLATQTFSSKTTVLATQDSCLEKVKQIAEKFFWSLNAVFNLPINFFTQGLADFLGLETLRHGTSWSNYIKIRMNGADPSFGGGEGGGTFGHKVAKTGNPILQEGYRNHSKGRFFAFLDTDAGKDTTYLDANNNEKTIRFNFFWRFYYRVVHVRIAPPTYAFGAGSACSAPKDMDGKIVTIWRFFNGILNFFLAPTVKLRFRPEDIPLHFQHDYKLPGRAVFTTKPISTDHLGLSGIFKQAIEGDIWKRMQANPAKTCWGLVRIANPIGIILLAAFGAYYTYKQYNPTIAHSTFSVLNAISTTP